MLDFSQVFILSSSLFRDVILISKLLPSISTVVSSANKMGNILFDTLVISFIYNMNSSGIIIEPCGTPQVTHFI